MKDENIKEILDNLNKNKNEIRTYCYYPDDVLSCDDLIKLLDYITNLQEEVKSANESITWWTNRFNAIQQENRRLKELCDKYEEEHSTTFKEWQEIRKEHSIMKQFIYENGLWERLLNDDRFLEHLRSDDNG